MSCVSGVRSHICRRVYSGCHGDFDSTSVRDVGVSDSLGAAADVRLAARTDVTHDRHPATERRRPGNAVGDVTVT